MNIKWHNLALFGCKIAAVFTTVALFVGIVTPNSAFAASMGNHHTANNKGIYAPAAPQRPLDCLTPQDHSNNGYGFLNVPGGVVEMSDYFHYASCDTLINTNFTFDGNDFADWSAPSFPPHTQIDLTSTITVNGIGTTINIPPGASLTQSSSNAATHTDTQTNAISDGFSYNGLTATVNLPAGVTQNDTANYHINGQGYEVGASVTLPT